MPCPQDAAPALPTQITDHGQPKQLLQAITDPASGRRQMVAEHVHAQVLLVGLCGRATNERSPDPQPACQFFSPDLPGQYTQAATICKAMTKVSTISRAAAIHPSQYRGLLPSPKVDPSSGRS